MKGKKQKRQKAVQRQAAQGQVVQGHLVGYQTETKEQCAARCAVNAPVRWQDARAKYRQEQTEQAQAEQAQTRQSPDRQTRQAHLGQSPDYQTGLTARQKPRSMPDYWTTK